MQEEYLHGGIGCTDAERILASRGVEPIMFPHQYEFSLKAKLSRLFFLLQALRMIKAGDTIFFIYPTYAKMIKWLIHLLLKKDGVKMVCCIMDIDGIKDGDKHLLKREISFFRKIKYFILLNDKMRQWLSKQVPNFVSSVINFHSFLAPPAVVMRKKSSEIVFAGNLEKSPFLEKLYLLHSHFPHLHFNLYGPGKTAALVNQPNVDYYGIESPYKLPTKLNGSFGLIWEGESIEKPSGSLGHYIQYISHHKLSLYILAKLPIIVAASAATAPLIEEFKIGFTINNLYEIEEKIRTISDRDYLEMQANMGPLAKKISSGVFLNDAIDEVMKLV